ncbi:hypothetical protein HDU76_004773 [Blyttiomyces sp. JEL0837]|nr:hypothetical protein HDU76_004773 [Blyttiomyces sp. JEL0837]
MATITITRTTRPTTANPSRPPSSTTQTQASTINMPNSESFSTVPIGGILFSGGGLRVIKKTENSVIVVGNTFDIKDRLKELRGRFNKELSVDDAKRAGWVFSISNSSAAGVIEWLKQRCENGGRTLGTEPRNVMPRFSGQAGSVNSAW